MAKSIVVIKSCEFERTQTRHDSGILIDPVRITGKEYFDLRRLTQRRNSEADAIFGVDSEGALFATNRFGLSKQSNRRNLNSCSWVLDQLNRSLSRYREQGGRFFVDLDGAYWKTSTTAQQIKFVNWEWKDDRPEEPPQLTVNNFSRYPRLAREYRARTLPEYGRPS